VTGTREQAEQTVRSLFAAFNARDDEATLAFVHPELEFWPQPTAERLGRSEPYRGREGFREYLADVDRAWEQFVVEPDDFRVAGTGVIAFGHAEAQPRGTTVTQRLPVIWVFRLRDGLVVSCRVARTAAEATELVAGGDAAAG
jgi:ketosteroid isomerase-like protein